MSRRSLKVCRCRSSHKPICVTRRGTFRHAQNRDYDGGSNSNNEESITPKGRVRPKFNDQGEGEPQDQGEDRKPDQKRKTTKLEELMTGWYGRSTPVDYIPWNDFFTFPVRARIWDKVTAIGKRVYMSREQMKRRFGKKLAKLFNCRRTSVVTVLKTPLCSRQIRDKGEVFEIWKP